MVTKRAVELLDYKRSLLGLTFALERISKGEEYSEDRGEIERRARELESFTSGNFRNVPVILGPQSEFLLILNRYLGEQYSDLQAMLPKGERGNNINTLAKILGHVAHPEVFDRYAGRLAKMFTELHREAENHLAESVLK